MPLLCLGISHHTAPAEVRERHAFGAPQISEALFTLLEYPEIKSAAILSTCNRLEMYVETGEDSQRAQKQLIQFLANFRHGEVGYDIQPYLYTLRGDAVVEHLLRVATGLDSMLIGENEILGQVRAAHERSKTARCLSPLLNRLFSEALKAGKAARSQTAIGNSSISIATAAVNAARAHIDSLEGRSVLLIGAGSMAVKAAKRFKREGAAELTVVNRTVERAQELVDTIELGTALPFECIDEVLKKVDVVVTSTLAPHVIIERPMVERAMEARDGRPLCIVDIALPRDVEPSVAEVPGVRLVDLDALGEPVDRVLAERSAEIPRVEAIIDDHLHAFFTWCELRDRFELIAAESQRAEHVREAELARLLAKCPELSDRERALVTGLTLRIVSKIMHPTFVSIREGASTEIKA